MRYSTDMQRKQKPEKGYLAENRVELQGMQEVRSITAASENGISDGNEYASKLLEAAYPKTACESNISKHVYNLADRFLSFCPSKNYPQTQKTDEKIICDFFRLFFVLYPRI